jgi:GNAT superfamily N-acetyltransferase
LLHSRTIPILDDSDSWVAVCFVVRAGYRRHGLMHRLLAGAVEHAAGYGAEVVEGYPVETGGGRVDVISGYVGTVELFERAGFERAAPTTGRSGGQPRWVMRSHCEQPRADARPPGCNGSSPGSMTTRSGVPAA